MLTSYHCHTKWSDGEDTVPAMAQAAGKRGLAELGISDHYLLHPHGAKHGWAMPSGRVQEYIGEIRATSTKTGIRVRAGLEVDWFGGKAGELVAKAVSGMGLDYAIGAVHFIEPERTALDCDRKYWESMSQSEVDAAYLKYWGLVRGMAASGLFQVAAHLDLPKKFGFYPKRDMTQPVSEALEAVRKSGMAVELNTAGWSRPCKECYPSADILRLCLRKKIPVMLAADAHAAAELTRDYDRGAAVLRKIGFESAVMFGDRGFQPVPLAPAGRAAGA